MRTSVVLLSCVALTFDCGCTAPSPSAETPPLPSDIKAAIVGAEQIELISLAPVRIDANDSFHGWKVLGRLSVSAPSQRDAIVAVMVDSMERIGTQSLCFEPRHGITFVRGGRKTDLVICFTCGNVEAFRGGAEPAVSLGCPDAAALWLDRQFEYEGIQLAPKGSPNQSPQLTR